MRPLLRIAAIDFLNPAPLMWNFEHEPAATELLARYTLERMTPAECAASLANGTADLGLIPVGAYAGTPDLVVVPGCAIASTGSIRSLLLVVRSSEGEAATASGEEPDLAPPTAAELAGIRTVALDTSSRTTALYTQILFRRFWGHTPTFTSRPPALDRMLAEADAAVLIGDPALHALRDRVAREARTGERLRYLDLAHLWRAATGTTWVSAFWAIRQQGLEGLTAQERSTVIADLQQSRDAGLAHIPDLVREWAPRLALRPELVHTYLSRNIHYLLDENAIAGIERFFYEAHALGLMSEPRRIEWMTG